jgi:crotonobetainyl-CoA:carnitine CoA-transferase CaiB-like acyl-CoA transferase
LEIGGYAAAYCGRLFAKAGADVVRVELAPTGDKATPPPAWASDEAMALYLHSGKRRMSIADPDLLATLAGKADIVACDAGTADDLVGLGFDSWTTPIKVAITPFGRTGPKRNWRATPSVILAMGGYTQLMGDPDRAPLNLPGHYLEFQTGTLAYAAANACRLADKEDVIDIGMYETLMSLSQFTTVRWHCAGELRSRHGSDFWFVVPSNLFACADGWVYVNIVPAFWDPLTVLLGQPELLLDPRFANNDLRMENRDALHEIIAAELAPVSKAELTARAAECRVPLGAVQTFDEVLGDPHLAARGFFEQVEDATGRRLQSPGLPFRIGPGQLEGSAV